ncbi:YceI family protein [Psychromonas sp. MB-3u-54]|uniref:YceI family protein n=1 Tax=Psychromonas sp. MB-3u-54 TaxID=2058319 RepID=UPI000C333AC9|nr:YceI family protein [Psychromonas sp. MB-3u-54]PKH03130.1 YceI family protein [Psychromonas sp. MB-3u-54]
MKGVSIIALLLVCLSPSAFAQWELQESESTLNVVSVKKSTVGEVHSFSKINGSINDAGEVMVNIDLGSIETNVDVRNERMKAILFETSDFMEAKISGSVNVNKLSELNAGDTYIESVKFNLSLHGVSREITSDVQVTKLSGERLLVTSLKPFILSANDYGLAEGIEMLRTVASLPSISTAVPVTYNFIFKK